MGAQYSTVEQHSARADCFNVVGSVSHCKLANLLSKLLRLDSFFFRFSTCCIKERVLSRVTPG